MRIGWPGRAVMGSMIGVFVVAVGLFGWPRQPGGDESDRGPYRVAELEVVGASDEGEMVFDWAPSEAMVEQWFGSALRHSDRGLSRGEEGMAMRAKVQYSTWIDNRRDGARMRVDVDVQLERMFIAEEAPMVTLTARAEFRHPFGLSQPTRAVLTPISRTLARQAVDDAVAQLRDQAVVRQSLGEELAERINDMDSAESARVLAINRVVSLAPENALGALEIATDDPDKEVAMAAARALYMLEADGAAHALMRVAQRMSRDRDYDRYMALLPLLGKLDEPWVALYLETVADGHRIRRVRQQARSLVEEEARTSPIGGGPQTAP